MSVGTIGTSYNTASEVISVTDSSSSISYVRDNLGRATTLTNTFAAPWVNTSLTQVFDIMGNRTELRASIGSRLDFKNTYAYDKLNRLTEIIQTSQTGGSAVAAKRVSFDYNSLGQRTQLSRFQSTGTTNAVATTTFSYDPANRLSGIAHEQGANLLNSYSYGYDRMSRITSVNSVAEGLSTFQYRLDSQLTGVTNTGVRNESYEYDANGNRNTAGYSLSPDNRTTVIPPSGANPGFTYQYDNEGNVIRKVNNTTQDVTTYEWDHRNRLVSVLEQTPNTRIEYQYDPLNRLVSRYNPTGAGQSTRQYWVYDEGINPVLEFSSYVSNDPTHRYLWSNEVDELLADEQISGGGSNTLWGLADHLGTIRDIADRNETTGVTSVVNHRRYDTYGNRLSQSGPSEISFGYTGKYFDETTRLQNNYSRWYDPRLGKWISQDPIGFAAGDANLYRYVGNSPTMATDPSGLRKEPAPIDETLERGFSVAMQLILAERKYSQVYDRLQYLKSVSSIPYIDAISIWRRSSARKESLFLEAQLRSLASDIDTIQSRLLGDEFSEVDVPEFSFARTIDGILEQGGGLGGEQILNFARLQVGQYSRSEAGMVNTTIGDAMLIAPTSLLRNGLARLAISKAPKGAGLLDDVADLGRFRYCFPAGTPVRTPHGSQSIELLSSGDKVLAWSVERNCLVTRKVVTTFSRVSQELIVVHYNGTSVQTTNGHPFWVVGTGWKVAEDLQVGDRLLGTGGESFPVERLEPISGLTCVFNFEVEDDHNYFVGSTPILVHNQDIHPSFNKAVEEALAWLRAQGIDTAKPERLVMSKMRLDPNFGRPIGVAFEGGGSYRIEYHDVVVDGVKKPHAHINVQVKKLDGPHILFKGNQQSVNTLVRQLFTCSENLGWTTKHNT
jgi:RHS repeat-associated protein